jgi:hypothetical protein
VFSAIRLEIVFLRHPADASRWSFAVKWYQGQQVAQKHVFRIGEVAAGWIPVAAARVC